MKVMTVQVKFVNAHEFTFTSCIPRYGTVIMCVESIKNKKKKDKYSKY